MVVGGGGRVARHRAPDAVQMERRKVEEMKKGEWKKTKAEQDHRENVKPEQIANILNTVFPQESIC